MPDAARPARRGVLAGPADADPAARRGRARRRDGRAGQRRPARAVASGRARCCSRAFGGGIAAPSANRFGRISPTQAAHVADDLGDAVALILDGGACDVGIESTIVALHRRRADAAASRRDRRRASSPSVLGRRPRAPDASAPRASGTLAVALRAENAGAARRRRRAATPKSTSSSTATRTSRVLARTARRPDDFAGAWIAAPAAPPRMRTTSMRICARSTPPTPT